MRNKALNTGLILVVVLIMVVFAAYVRVGATADSVVVLKTSGLSCSSCVAKVNKALQSERGVASTEVDLSGGLVVAGFDSKKTAPEKLAKRVGATGFESTVQAVLTPEQFRKMAGHDIGKQGAASGCCGGQGCGGK